MNCSLQDEIALIRGKHSFLLIAKALGRFPLCIETAEGEVCQGVDPMDLIVVSAPEGGAVEPGVMMIELVRKYHIPLLVLPGDHPGSKRLLYVISVGSAIHTTCSIQRGTHPEQEVICCHGEFDGITFTGTDKGFTATHLPDGITMKRLKYQIRTEIF
jgi:hypothetical protein